MKLSPILSNSIELIIPEEAESDGTDTLTVLAEDEEMEGWKDKAFYFGLALIVLGLITIIVSTVLTCGFNIIPLIGLAVTLIGFSIAAATAPADGISETLSVCRP